MRIRFKPWARPELEASTFYIDNPEDYKGKWKDVFKNDNPIHLELGCGKGSFMANLAVKNQNINYIAIDVVDAMLGLAKRNIEEKYKEQKIRNNRYRWFGFDVNSDLLWTLVKEEKRMSSCEQECKDYYSGS